MSIPDTLVLQRTKKNNVMLDFSAQALASTYFVWFNLKEYSKCSKIIIFLVNAIIDIKIIEGQSWSILRFFVGMDLEDKKKFS